MDIPRIYHVYTSSDIPCIYKDIPCISSVEIHGISLDIQCISTTLDIPCIYMDIPRIYQAYWWHWHMPGIYMVYTRHILKIGVPDASRFWSLISNELWAVKHEGFRHYSDFAVARMPIEWRFVQHLNLQGAKCSKQTQCVFYVVFTRQRYKALKYMLLPLSTLASKDLGIKIK